ncbi:hypothetical protein NN561_018291 [Cricetulus griseus]
MLCIKYRKAKPSCLHGCIYRLYSHSPLFLSFPKRNLRPNFLFEVSGLPGAALLCRLRSPEPDLDSVTLPPLLQLSLCPDTARTSHRLHSRAGAAEPLDNTPWEAFDVMDSARVRWPSLGSPLAQGRLGLGWPNSGSSGGTNFRGAHALGDLLYTEEKESVQGDPRLGQCAL